MTVGVAVGMTVAWAVFQLSRPSTDDLQRQALDELGLGPAVESAPFLEPLLDDITERVSRRVVHETTTSMVSSAAAGVVVSVAAGTALLLILDRRD